MQLNKKKRFYDWSLNADGFTPREMSEIGKVLLKVLLESTKRVVFTNQLSRIWIKNVLTLFIFLNSILHFIKNHFFEIHKSDRK